jgi:N-methylhydantoinase A/oxoprolinase/acetone carboxylase beta subunit
LDDGYDGELTHTLTLHRPVVAIGAPVEAYMPQMAAKLNTELTIPPHAEVANAVGAVVGGVVQRQRVLITPLDGDENLRLHLPQGVKDFRDLEEAVNHANAQMQTWMEALARQAGADQVEVQMTRHDSLVQVRMGWGDELYLGSELIFTAVGRPSPTSRDSEA